MKNKKSFNQYEKIPSKFFPFLWHFVRPVKWGYFSWLFLTFVTSILWGTIDPLFSKEIVRRIEMFSGAKSELLAQILPIILFFIGAGIISILLSVVRIKLRDKYVRPLKEIITADLTKYVHRNSLQYISDSSSGKIFQKISDAANISQVIQDILWLFVSTAIIFLSNIVIIASINSKILCMFIGWVSIHILWSIYRLKDIQKEEKIVAELRSKSSGKIIDTLINFLNVKMFSFRNTEEKELDKDANAKIKSNQSVSYLYRTMWVPQDFFSAAFYFLVIYTSIKLYQVGDLNLSDIVYFFTVFNFINRRLSEMTDSLSQIIADLTSVKMGIKAVVIPISVKDSENAKELVVKSGEIEFTKVSFKYKKNWIINDFNLKIKSHEKIGIVGASGAGKTTLVNLLLRFYDVSKGSITIDNQEISKVKQDSLRHNISLVAQDTTMFNRTVYDNIAYAKPNSPRDKVINASKLAHADEFIKNMPDKYDTMVGERGVKLSGGQRQRISIARALLKDSKIVILDEATSALDSKTENFIQKKFFGLLKGKTTIAIAHRLSTLKNMDRIVVLKKGRIIEEGSHAELMKKPKGEYAKLWKLQSGGFINPEESDEILV